MKNIEKKLDVAFQKLAIGKRCHFCHRPAHAIHHLIRRSCKLRRWDKKNALPICSICHFKVHNGQLEEPIVEFERDNIRDYLMRNNLIYKEFLQIKEREFKL